MSLEGSIDLATRLIPREQNITPRTWDLCFPTAGSYVVKGTAGSGQTSISAETELHQMKLGPNRESNLVVAASKESGSRLHEDITTRLAAAQGQEFTAESAIVRSVHSLAFALLRQDSD